MKDKVDIKITTDSDKLVDYIMSLASSQPKPTTKEEEKAIVDDLIQELLYDTRPEHDDAEKYKYSLSPNRGMYSEQKTISKKKQDSQKRIVNIALLEIGEHNFKTSNIFNTAYTYIKLFDKSNGKRFLVPRRILLDLINRPIEGNIRKTKSGDEFYVRVEVEKKFLIETI